MPTTISRVEVKPIASREKFVKFRGEMLDPKRSWTFVDENAIVKDAQTGKTIARLFKNYVKQDVIDEAYDNLLPLARKNVRNRGAAAGKINRSESDNSTFRRTKRDGTISKFWESNPVKSSTLGYLENGYGTSFKYPEEGPIRLTRYAKKYPGRFESAYPLVRRLDSALKTANRSVHAKLERSRELIDGYTIGDSVFTSCAVNLDFRTAVHQDARNLGEWNCLTVLRRSDDRKHGGAARPEYLMLPRYRVAFNVSSGDVLAMHSSEWHCNSDFGVDARNRSPRLSVVGFFREPLLRAAKDLVRSRGSSGTTAGSKRQTSE